MRSACGLNGQWLLGKQCAPLLDLENELIMSWLFKEPLKRSNILSGQLPGAIGASAWCTTGLMIGVTTVGPAT